MSFFAIKAYTIATRVTEIIADSRTEKIAIKKAVKLWRDKTNPVKSDRNCNTEAKVREQEYFIRDFVKVSIALNPISKCFELIKETRTGFESVCTQSACFFASETKEGAIDQLVKIWSYEANDELGSGYLLSNVEQTGCFIHDGIAYSVE